MIGRDKPVRVSNFVAPPPPPLPADAMLINRFLESGLYLADP